MNVNYGDTITFTNTIQLWSCHNYNISSFLKIMVQRDKIRFFEGIIHISLFFNYVHIAFVSLM